MTNKEIIEQAQLVIISRGDNPDYPLEKHLRDMNLIADLTELKLKYQ